MPNKIMELGHRFTDEAYASKEEVKAVYNLPDVSDIWNQILLYRSFYNAETELKDASLLSYKICLTRKLSSQAYSLQTRLLNDLLKFYSLSLDTQKKFLLDKETEALVHTAQAIAPSVSENTLRKLANGEIESTPASLFALKAYSLAYQKSYGIEKITIEEIERLNNIVSGENEDTLVHYRKETKADILNPLVAPEPAAIHDHLERLVAFLNNEEIPAILKALTIPYVFDYLRPFEFYNEETAVLVSKAFMNLSGFGLVGFTLNFESIAYSNAESFFRRLKLTESSLDLTYILNRFLAFLTVDEMNLSDSLKELSIQGMQVNPSSSETVPLSPSSGDTPVATPTSTLALPIFPSTDSSEKIEATARKLREVHPQLKRKQAHFYAGHCTVGLHYTIEQFKAEEHTVYETARTSMEDLANRGFYKKEQIGKKFVYTPIPNVDD